MKSWFRKDRLDDIVTRPVYKSDFNWTNVATRGQLRVLLGYLVIREMPIKSFYIRSWISYFYLIYFCLRGLGRGFNFTRPIVMMNHPLNYKPLINYPDLFYWNLSRVMPSNPIVRDTHREWRMRQTPVFHQYHKTTYRYRLRQPRYVPWDGSMNQPVMPYLIDTGSGVINGTFKRNCNSSPQLKWAPKRGHKYISLQPQECSLPL